MRVDRLHCPGRGPNGAGRCHENNQNQGIRTMFARSLAGLALALGASVAAAGQDLTALSLEQLMGLKIVGASKYEQAQSEVAAAAAVITRDEIRAYGWRTLDEALSSLPGVHTTYDRQYTYFGARGFGLPGDLDTRLLVTINGNRINDPIYDTGAIGRIFPIDLELVDRIEFIPGPGSAVYGQNAMFGVVNVITRTGADISGAEIAAIHGRPERGTDLRVSAGRRLENGLDVLVSASRYRARGKDRFMEFGSTGIAGVAAGLDGERDGELFARVAGRTWSFELIRADRNKSDPTGMFLSDPLLPGQFQRDGYTLAHWQHQQALRGGDLQLQTRLFAGRYDYDSRLMYGTPLDFPGAGRWQGAELRLVSTEVAGHRMMAGVELTENSLVRQQIVDVAAPANDLTINGSSTRAGLYLQDEWRIAPTVSATLGMRVDHHSRSGTRASPRAALIWTPVRTTVFKALAGRAYRQPNAYERDYYDGVAQTSNPSLGGEAIDTLELVVDHRANADLALRASAYQWMMRDLVTMGVDPLSGLPQFQSGADVRARGLELSADRTWRGGIRARASVALQDAGYVDGGTLINSPRLLAKANVAAPLPWAGLRLGYEWRFNGRRSSRDGSTLGGYAVSGLYLRTDALGRGIELALRVRNLFDKRYQHPMPDTNWQNALVQDGRSAHVEVRLAF